MGVTIWSHVTRAQYRRMPQCAGERGSLDYFLSTLRIGSMTRC